MYGMPAPSPLSPPGEGGEAHSKGEHSRGVTASTSARGVTISRQLPNVLQASLPMPKVGRQDVGRHTTGVKRATLAPATAKRDRRRHKSRDGQVL
ncbi:hypothetical protein OAN61_00735 [bacterium]|nr:hypothetical protein [bacterium]